MITIIQNDNVWVYVAQENVRTIEHDRRKNKVKVTFTQGDKTIYEDVKELRF